MVHLTQSLQEWLWRFHPDKIGLVMLGHTELMTKAMVRDYIEWCKTEEGLQYLKGGNKYVDEDDVHEQSNPDR